jgi:hypothetical protein
VSFVIKPVEPELPNSVWLEPPPKAAPISDPLPVWRRTTKIRATATTTWITESTVIIFISP